MCVILKHQGEPQGTSVSAAAMNQQRGGGWSACSWQSRRSCLRWMTLCCLHCHQYGALRCSARLWENPEMPQTSGPGRVVRVSMQKAWVLCRLSPWFSRATSNYLNYEPVLFASKPLSPSQYLFPVSSMNEMGPMGWKESVVKTKL